MSQELHFSLSSANRKIARENICKIAFKTIPRCGIAALILLCMGLYFLFPACKTFQQIQTEKNTPYELSATTDSGSIDLNTLKQIEGVERISPVLTLKANLSSEEYKLDCEIRAVYSNFLTPKFVQGTMYPDSSNMPYLILNKIAAKSFAQDDQTVTVSAEDTVMMNTNGTERKAIICGIFDDGSETPIVYMSYDVAQKEYGTSGQTELVFLLNNVGSAEDVVSALKRQTIHASFDPSITRSWELLHNQCWQTLLLSIGLLIGAVVLIQEKRSTEKYTRHSEIAMLHLSGLTADAVSMIYPLRIALSTLVASLLALVAALLLGSFSALGIGMSVLYTGIITSLALLNLA